MFRLLQYTINIYCNDDRLKISVPHKMWRFLCIFINYPATFIWKHKQTVASEINELYKFTFTTYLEKGLLKC